MMILFVLLAVTTVYGQDRPKIQGEIRNNTIKEFQDGILNCKIKSMATMKSTIQWIKIDSQNPVLISVGETLQATNKKYKVGVAVDGDVTTSSLTIQRASRKDAGRYRCIVRIQELPYTEWDQKDGFLFVQVMPQIQGEIKNASAFVQQNGMLHCIVLDLTASQSVVQWIKLDIENPVMISVGDSITESEKSKYEVKLSSKGEITTSTLTILNLTKEDAGKYRCIVQTRGIQYREWPQKEGFLNVHAWPDIQGNVNNHTVHEREEGRLYCNVMNLTPKSQIEWAKIKNGRVIMISLGKTVQINREKYKVKLTTSGNWSMSTLAIKSVTKKDVGQFRCIVQTPDISYTQWPQKDGFLALRGNGPGPASTSRDNGSPCSKFNFKYILLLFVIFVCL